jgi:hypothetical protein
MPDHKTDVPARNIGCIWDVSERDAVMQSCVAAWIVHHSCTGAQVAWHGILCHWY